MQERILLVVSGPPASGKTTLGRLLAERLGWPLLEKDAFKEALFDTLGTGDADWSRRLSEAAFARQYAAAHGILAGGRSVVLEGNFRLSHCPALTALAERGGAELAQVACRASPRTLEARLAARQAGGLRHPGHADGALAGRAAALAAYAPLPIGRTVAFDSEAATDVAALLDALRIRGRSPRPGCGRTGRPSAPARGTARSASCPWRSRAGW